MRRAYRLGCEFASLDRGQLWRVVQIDHFVVLYVGDGVKRILGAGDPAEGLHFVCP